MYPTCSGSLGTCLLVITISQISLILTGVNVSANKHLLGVQPDSKSKYDLASGQFFKCLDGSGSIPLEFVNDDYCDCRDASDEPGTAACPHGRFYCPNEGYIPRVIPSSWVNDGQCDCCDASDELNNTAACENSCMVLGEIYRLEQERSREISNQGSAIRSQYKQQAKERREQNEQLLEQYRRELREKEDAIKKIEEEVNSDYGPGQVFFPLKDKCYNFKDREYTYILCPFERATQESTGGMQTELGRWSAWAGPTDNLYSKQRYEGGIQCWNGPTRSAMVNIACGVEDKIIAVSEPAKCEYVYDFITPAACPDLDPPEPESSESNDQQVTSESPIPVQTVPSLEVEDDQLDTSNYYPDEHNEAPDGEISSPDEDRHDEL